MPLNLQLDTGLASRTDVPAPILSIVPPVEYELANYVKRSWEGARLEKNEHVTQALRDAKEEREYRYDPDKLRRINSTGGSTIHIGLLDFKARIVAAWLKDLLLGQEDKAWGLNPTPIPELPTNYNATIDDAVAQMEQEFEQLQGTPPPQEMMQKFRDDLMDQVLEELRGMARDKTEKMESAIDDILTEGGFYQALMDIIDDLMESPAVFIKFPEIRNKPELSWTQDSEGNWSVTVENKLKPYVRRVDPANAFPSEGAKNVRERAFHEVGRMTRRQLEEMKGIPGANDTEIDKVLTKHLAGGLNNWLGILGDDEVGDDVKLELNHYDATFDFLTSYLDVPGKMLNDWGMRPAVDADRVHAVSIVSIGEHVVKSSLNYHPLGYNPYHSTAFYKENDRVWGRSLFQIIKPIGDMANANARAIANNAGLASGPQVDYNVDRLPKGQELSTMTPWKIWQTRNDPMGNNTPAIRFYQPDDRLPSLTQLFGFWSQMADEYLGLNDVMTGARPGTVGRTASGMQMMMNSAAKFHKAVIMNIDELVQSIVSEAHLFVMRYSSNQDIKGDVKVVAKGAIALSIRENLQLRRQEFLASTANEIDLQATGIEGRAHLLREVAKGLEIDPDELVPGPTPQMPQAAGQPGQPVQPVLPQGTGAPPGPSPGQTLSTGEPIADNFSPPPQG